MFSGVISCSRLGLRFHSLQNFFTVHLEEHSDLHFLVSWWWHPSSNYWPSKWNDRSSLRVYIKLLKHAYRENALTYRHMHAKIDTFIYKHTHTHSHVILKSCRNTCRPGEACNFTHSLPSYVSTMLSFQAANVTVLQSRRVPPCNLANAIDCPISPQTVRQGNWSRLQLLRFSLLCINSLPFLLEG